MQGLLKLLLVCGILLAVAACTQAVAVSHAEDKRALLLDLFGKKLPSSFQKEDV